jgi:hypothetical protein
MSWWVKSDGHVVIANVGTVWMLRKSATPLPDPKKVCTL